MTSSETNNQRSISFSMCTKKVLAITLAMTCVASAQTTILVDKDNCPPSLTVNQDNPFCSIQDAINASVDGDTIEVAPGTYHEAIDFMGKAIILRSIRGPALTIIDSTTVPAASETVSVVRCVNGETATTVLDGFTITGGTGDSAIFDEPLGGGMFNNDSSPTINNCIFINNQANFGGGMYNRSSSPTITNCTFIDNTTLDGHGGGIRNFTISAPTITNCTFHGNKTTNGVGGGIANERSIPTIHGCTFDSNTAEYGGGIYNSFSLPMVTNCSFIANTSTNGRGGGMRNFDSDATVTNCTFRGNKASKGNGGGIANANGRPTITNCSITGNSATIGGGIFNNFSRPKITNCTLSGNVASSLGGGVYNDLSDATLTNCMFNGNVASTSGGGLYNNNNSDPILTNCMFNGNVASTSGGGLYNDNNSDPTLTNCTLSRNSASDGGGIYNNYSNPTMTNCILWGDTPGEIFNVESAPTFSFCLVEGSGGSTAAWNTMFGIDGDHNLDADPLFIDPLGLDGLAGTEDDNLRIRSISPAINAGNDSAVPMDITTDLNSLPRFICEVDMGAYENESPAMRVHNTTTDMGFCTIQECINAAADTQTCVAQPGIYFESLDFLGKAITLRSLDGPATTIIDATSVPNSGNQVSVVRCANGETSATVLDGFTITGGTGDTSIFSNPVGGGMFIHNSNPTVTNCTFIGNKADFGGGIMNSISDATFTNCTFSGNEAIWGGGMRNFNLAKPKLTRCTFNSNKADVGGGMYNSFLSSPTITYCAFRENIADEFGGGMYNADNSNPTLSNCSLIKNTAGSGGGGIYSFGFSSPTIINSIISGNTAARGGGLYNFDSSNPTITNCSFFGNVADSGGGMFTVISNPTITNSILWDNIPDEIVNATLFNNISTPTINYSNIKASGGSSNWDTLLGIDGGGNIDSDPLFIDPLGLDGIAGTIDDDLHLMHDSPCIDAADHDAYLSVDGGLTDLDGKDRIIDNKSAMDTGVGAITYLDMGAYENGLCPTDGIFDLNDLDRLDSCLIGPNGDLNLGCTCIDLNKDEHINLRDFAHLQLVFNP